MAHKKIPSFTSSHKGVKSKQVLEQELFSLWNRSGQAMSSAERANWQKAWVNTLNEYMLRFPAKEWMSEWRKWVKPPRA